NVPRIVKTVLPLVLIIYLLTVISFFTALTKDELLHSQAIGVTWAQTALGPASSIISISVGLIALGSVNATFLSSGRLSGVAAKNGQMPDVVSWVHVRSKTPLITVALRCVIAIVVMCVADGQELLRFYIFTVWLFHGSSILALLVLRFKKKNKKRPYKVDLWIPVVVVTGISYLLLAPFLITPKKEFITALALIGLSLISYYPINWLKSKKVINVPDKLTIWLQLFLRLAPKRDLRRERRSLLRTMNMLARESIIITPNTGGPTNEMIRRFSRRFSHLSKVDGSPAVIRRLVDETGQMSLRQRIPRGASLAELDFKSKKRASIAALIHESSSSPAIIRKKPSLASNSFNHADVSQLKSPPSLPILKNRFNPTPEATEETKPGSLAPVSSMISQIAPHQTIRPQPSTIQEEDLNVSANSVNIIKERKILLPEELQVIADFESDGGGEYEVLAHPDDVQRISFSADPGADDSKDSSDSDSDSDSSSTSENIKRSVFSTIFASSTCSSTSSSISGDDELSDFDPIDTSTLPNQINDQTVHPNVQSLSHAQNQSINLSEDEKMRSELQSEA
ncbi:b(0,+)-type amino acid transporter 1, partial [Bulinus truncatus]